MFMLRKSLKSFYCQSYWTDQVRMSTFNVYSTQTHQKRERRLSSLLTEQQIDMEYISWKYQRLMVLTVRRASRLNQYAKQV
jgi:hypothetical protein